MNRLTGIAIAALAVVSANGAEWIAGNYRMPDEAETNRFFEAAANDVVAKNFKLGDGEIYSAVWRVVAPGMRDLFVNGKRVSPTALAPWTAFDKVLIEESFDVKGALKSGGENELRIELGNGWYNPLPLRMWYHYNLRETLAVGTPCVKATLDIVYANGKKESIETDGSWRTAEGRIMRNSIYLGVTEDMRREVRFDKPARIAKGPKGKIYPAGDFPKTVVYDSWKATKVTAVSNGVWLVDMGVNAAGTLRVKLRGVKRGDMVRLRQGERMWDDGTLNPLSAVAGQIKVSKRGPLFGVAEECDSVISAGEEEFTFEPRFTFHVLRYVQVDGLREAPKPEDFEMLAWSADVKDRSHFACSNERLNKLHEICRRTFRSNLQSVQSDCPGREKFGYGGDIACTEDSMRVNYDMAAFYRKTVRDFVVDSEGGLIPETAPYMGIASSSVFPKEKRNGYFTAGPMGWCVGLPVMVDSLIKYDGDLETAKYAYPVLVEFIRKAMAEYPDNDIPKCLGDWVPAEDVKADETMSSLAHWHQFLKLAAKIGRLIGSSDAAEFEQVAAKVAAKFERLYVKNGKVCKGKQGEQLFALYHGLMPANQVETAKRILCDDIVARGYSHTLGIFCLRYLFEYLPENGGAEIVGKVVQHEGYPGYFYMMDRGATTLWEGWRVKEVENHYSNCHPMFGSVDAWFIRHLLGISVCDDAVGCNRVKIAPKPVDGVTSASGWFDTPHGRISLAWKLVNGKLDITKSVPAGITEVK